MNMRLPALLAAWAFACVAGGCAFPTGGATKDTPRQVGGAETDSPGSDVASGGPTISSAELDELTRAFADRYVGLLASACDSLKKDNPDPAQRREAQILLVNGATNVYDIASNADAFTRVLDLVVVTTLVSQVWIDDGRAGEVFGDRAEVLVRALRHGRLAAWALAAQVLRPEQIDLLERLLREWRTENPDMVRAYFVRFSNFSIGRGKSAHAELLAAGGLFANVAEAGQAIDEVRLLAERMFYQLKREPTLLRWQAEALQDTALATPEVGKAFMDMHRLTDQFDQLPKNVAAERQAILAAFDEREQALNDSFGQMRAAMSDANKVAASLGEASDAINAMLQTADALVARFDTGDAPAAAQPSRPFDIREYTTAVREVSVAAGELNEVLNASNELLGSPDWNRRVQHINESADERVRKAAEQSQQVVNNFFWRLYAALGIVFVMLIICLATAFVLMQRLAKRLADRTAGLISQGCHTADHKAGPVPDAGREGHPK